ncbi:hypothetical protein DER44DRAFT_162129 [Fusarium oxysporum]|nr:hypothetical protein DER44DRAFT_162129 [Fusarium oxysporum]
MVGIAGKSKACHNCKKRRVKCDAGRPRCMRCDKAGLICQGYTKSAAVFVNRTTRNLSMTAGDALAAAKQSRGHIPFHGAVDVAGEYQAMLHMFALSSYSTAAFRIKALRISQVLYLPQVETCSSRINISAVSWFVSTCQLEDPSLILDTSLLAFSAAQLHATGYCSVSLDNALRIYSDGLVKLSTALQYVDHNSSINVLASIVILSTCELFLCPSDIGWRAHVQGMAEILRLHNAHPHHNHSSQDWSLLCARARMITVLTDLISYRIGSLTPQQWRDILANHIEGDELNEILDIAHDLPGIFELTETPYRTVTAMAAVLERMRNWEKTFRLRSDQPLFVFVPSRMHNPADSGYPSKLFPNVLELQSLKVARCLLILWGATVQALDLIMCQYHANEEFSRACECHRRIWNFFGCGGTKDQTALQLMVMESNRCAWLICRCVEYLYGNEMGLVGHQSMIYAKWVITKHYHQLGMSRELAWCHNISRMSGPGATGRIQVMEFQY